MPLKDQISYDEFSKLDVRVGTITLAENVAGSTKLLKLTVDFGEEIGQRIILTGMAKYFKPEELVNLRTTFIVNLAPRKMMGLESHGMVFALDTEPPRFLKVEEDISNGVCVI